MIWTRGGAALLLALVLAGCGGSSGSAPAATMPSANDWPPSSVLELEEPEKPEVTGASSEVDAMAFSTYLTDSASWMLRTTFNAKVLRNHACTVCTDLVELADTARAERRIYELDDITAVTEGTYRLEARDPEDPTEYWQLNLLLDRPEIRVLDEHRREVEVLPAEQTRTILVLAAWDGQWYLYSWDDADRSEA